MARKIINIAASEIPETEQGHWMSRLFILYDDGTIYYRFNSARDNYGDSWIEIKNLPTDEKKN